MVVRRRNRFWSRLFQPQRSPEIQSGDDWDACVNLEIEQMAIVRDNEVRLPVYGAFQDAVIIRISGNSVDLGMEPRCPSCQRHGRRFLPHFALALPAT